MAVAFTREEDVEAAAAHLPDRPISPNRNMVTAEGLRALDIALAEALAAYRTAQASEEFRRDRSAMAQAARDLRYYRARRASAELVPAPADADTVQFGSTVTIDRSDGRQQTFRIVGEDEADVAGGSVSYVSPLARALYGKSVGDASTVGQDEVEIVALR